MPLITLKETVGETLSGAIDGVNTDYLCSFDFIPDAVNVYVNGLLKIRDWDDGFLVVGTRTVRMKEPLLTGDSLEVEYKADVLTGGGAPGGVPPAATITENTPMQSTSENKPATSPTENIPANAAKDLAPSLFARSLVPRLVRTDSEEDPCQ
jgi:hypothetical protein